MLRYVLPFLWQCTIMRHMQYLYTVKINYMRTDHFTTRSNIQKMTCGNLQLYHYYPPLKRSHPAFPNCHRSRGIPQNWNILTLDFFQMYGRYTRDLSAAARSEARRLKRLERRRKRDDKERERELINKPAGRFAKAFGKHCLDFDQPHLKLAKANLLSGTETQPFIAVGRNLTNSIPRSN